MLRLLSVRVNIKVKSKKNIRKKREENEDKFSHFPRDMSQRSPFN